MPLRGESFEGLAEVRKALRAIDGDAVKELKVELRAAGKIVADEAKRRAPVGRGGLRRSIRATVKGAGRNFRAEVRAGAVRRSKKYPQGYPYPLRIEFGGRGSSELGPRAFLWPAFEDKRDEVRARADEGMQRVISKWTGDR